MRLLQLILFLAVSNLYCQPSTADSITLTIEEKLKEVKTDSARNQLLLELNAHLLKSEFVDIEPRLTRVEESLESATSYDKTSHSVWLYKQFALAARRKAKYQEAINYYLNALEAIENSGDQRNRGPIFFNIGIVFDELKDFDQAKEYYKKGMLQWQDFDPDEGLANLYNRVGLNYRNKKQLDSALYYYNLAGKLYDSLGSEEGYYRLQNNIGSVFTKKKDYKKAIEMKLVSLSYYQKENKYESQSIIHYSIGTNFGRLKEYEQALKHLDTSILLAEVYKLQERRKRGYKRRSQVYYKMKDFEKAFVDQEKYYLLIDSLNKMEKSDELELMLRSQEAEKMEVLSKANLERQKATNIRNYIIIFVLGVLIVVLIAWQKKVTALSKLKAQVLRQELDEKERSLKMKENEVSDLLSESLAHIQQKRSILEELEASNEGKKDMQAIITELKAEKLEESKRLLIRKELLQKDKNFLYSLRQDHPALTDLDLELCALIQLKLDRKKIAMLRGTSIEAVKKSRYRLRKKLNLPNGLLLQDYLRDVARR